MVAFRLLCLISSLSITVSSTPYRFSSRAIRSFPQGLAHHLDSATVTNVREHYLISTKTSESNTTKEEDSWWPLWKTSNSDTDSKEEEEKEDPKETKPKRRWGRRRVKDDEGEDEETSEKDKAPAKNNKRQKKKDDKDDKEEGDDQEETEDRNNKKKKGKATEVETETTGSNATSTNTTATETREERKRREAMERYRDLYGIRQQLIDGRDRGSRPMSPEEYQRHVRTLNRDHAIAELVNSLAFSVMAVAYRWFFIKWLLNRREKITPSQHFVFERLNDRFARDSLVLKEMLEEPPLGVPRFLWNLLLLKRGRPSARNIFYGDTLGETFEKTSVVIELGDGSDSDMDLRYMADLITFLLSQQKALAFGTKQPEKREKGEPRQPLKPLDLEIIFKLNSSGGEVAKFGMAAAQVARLRGVEGITTTVCVDIVAASGGYMIASQADKLVAAPFAYVGSIGVIMETLNFHDVLRNYGVTPLVLKAGSSKNPLTTFGPVSKKDVEIKEQEMEKIHEQFKLVTFEGRPQLDGIEEDICDGSIFMGREALSLNLVDEVMTSDEYLMQRMLAGERVLKVYRSRQSRIAPHFRNPSAHDLLPHLNLKQRVQAFLSGANSDTYATWLCAFAFLKHVLGKTRL